MIVSIHQLHYLPWLRYFDKIARSDVFVALDDVQFTKNGWQNRNKIKHAQGWMYLTVPVYHQHEQNLDEVRINNQVRWGDKHWKSLSLNYSKAPYFTDHADFFRDIYAREWEHLNSLNWEVLSYLVKALGINARLVKSSELQVEGEATLRLVNICQALGADQYLTGAYAAKAYLDEDILQEHGIKALMQDWDCPRYRQCFPQAGFIPDLSVVDLLFNEGPESLAILLHEQQSKPSLAVAQRQTG